jgi:hypothetical protein
MGKSGKAGKGTKGINEIEDRERNDDRTAWTYEKNGKGRIKEKGGRRHNHQTDKGKEERGRRIMIRQKSFSIEISTGFYSSTD